MAGQRQPIELIKAKGRKHLTKDEIDRRSKIEVKPCADDIIAPSYLTAAQKKDFYKIANQLKKINIMGETDCDALARYIIAESSYAQAVKDLRDCQKLKPKIKPDETKPADELLKWSSSIEILDKRVDRYFKQAHTAAISLGLTISSRCRLVIPQTQEAPKENKFAKFEKRDA